MAVRVKFTRAVAEADRTHAELMAIGVMEMLEVMERRNEQIN
ncbi:hypothetical protein [uncultured Thiodictyon sp.]|nr:hypothetical protein [uncultured Thiodictyon sp.]